MSCSPVSGAPSFYLQDPELALELAEEIGAVIVDHGLGLAAFTAHRLVEGADPPDRVGLPAVVGAQLVLDPAGTPSAIFGLELDDEVLDGLRQRGASPCASTCVMARGRAGTWWPTSRGSFARQRGSSSGRPYSRYANTWALTAKAYSGP